ncbi:hypothetical protein [Corynebacterium alimapuense]|uniref:hypothetical protein n=1 Tax=Corynebacterium alimapuense TaxID=1576874 RepID=UPI00140203AC|nr:hypothetical protein [Corynebacterium alimapuense]
MGQEFKLSQEYFNEFDPERFANQIKEQAARDQAAREAAETAETTGTDASEQAD